MNNTLTNISKLIYNSSISETNKLSLLTSDLLYTFSMKNNLEIIKKRLENVLNNINNIENNTFCNGLSGIGWFFQYIINEKILDQKDVDELLIQIDKVAYNSALKSLKQYNHDFLHGATGNAVYLLERVDKNKDVRQYLSEILRGLQKISKKDKKGIYWEESMFYTNDNQGVINLSLSHGLASKIILLSKLYNQKINTKIVKELLEGSIKFMLKCKFKQENTFLFPTIAESNNHSNFSRLAWCYGDLGISIALWQAGVALQNENIKQEAINVCLHTTKRRTREETGVVDAGICHGTAGIAHIYNRMYRNTGRNEFKEAENYWVEETLKIATFKDGLAGYKSYQSEEFGGWKNDYGFLEGISGIALVLDSHLHPEIEPTWDRCLLLS